MKLLGGILLIALALNGVYTLPARDSNSPQDDAELVRVPLRRNEPDPDFKDFTGVIDTGDGTPPYPFLQERPTGISFGILGSFDDIFRRLRARLWPLALSPDDSETGSGDSSEIGSPLGFGLRPLATVNTQNGNTTSTVKVVDGHKVEINETTYGDENSLFRVRLVNVRPLESGEEVAEGVYSNQGEFNPVSSPTTEAPAPVPVPRRSELAESDEQQDLVKQPKDNEVRDIDDRQRTRPTTPTTKATTAPSTLASSSSIEAIAEDTLAASSSNIQPSIMSADLKATVPQQVEVEWEVEEHQQMVPAQDAVTMAHNEETEMPLDDSDSHNAAKPELLAAIENFGGDDDDDNDPQLKELRQQMQMQMHREREELESSDDEEEHVGEAVEMSDTFNEEWASLDAEAEDGDDEAADPANDLNNHIDIYENIVPGDLSNDIEVNDAAAKDPNFPINPDAEVFDVTQHGQMPTMAKFEKLSL